MAPPSSIVLAWSSRFSRASPCGGKSSLLRTLLSVWSRPLTLNVLQVEQGRGGEGIDDIWRASVTGRDFILHADPHWLAGRADVLPTDIAAGDFACGLLGFENGLDSQPVQIPADA